MNDYKLSPDDPRLTAYALGELAGEELAAVETALREDPAARAAVVEIRATAEQLAAALASEAAPALHAETSSARAAIIPGRDPAKLDGGDWLRPNIFQFPRPYLAAIGGLAAACIALMIVLHTPPRAEPKPAVRETAAARTPAPVQLDKKSVTAVGPAPAAAAGKTTAAVSDPMVPAASDVPAKRNGFILPETLTLLDQAKDTAALAKPAETLGINSTAPAATPAGSPEVGPGTVAPAAQQVAGRDDGKGAMPASPPDEKNPGKIELAVPAPANKSVVSADAKDERPAVRAEAQGPAPVAPATRAESAPRPAGVADTYDRTPFSETRGLPGFVPPIDLDKTMPRYSPPPGSRGESSVREHDNDYVSVAQHPVQLFPIDTDTTGYADVRRFLQKRQRPPPEVVHIEEMLNFFPFRYSPPKGDTPFAASMEVADAPWMPAHRLVRIGLKAREVTTPARPPANLIFVLDVLNTDRLSNGLPMIRDAIQFLIGRLRADDRVAIVSCLDGGILVLPPTPVAKTPEIFAALAAVRSDGSDNRARGLQLAYDVARDHFLAGGGNHIILCTDGNAGVTITAEGPLVRFIADKTKSGVTLTAFGFGMGIYRDSLIEVLAGSGQGNFGYINSRREAEKFLAEDVNGPPATIAKDVTVEVAFNPAKVASYRLIGYDNRELKREDFNGEAFGADEVGAGHAATALFEIVPVDAGDPAAVKAADPGAPASDPSELLTMKVRYKKPGGAIKRMLDFSLFDSRTRFVDASTDFKFAAAVAGLGMILRDSPHKGATTLPQVIEWAEAAAAGGDDPGGYRSEFVELAREAEKIER